MTSCSVLSSLQWRGECRTC